MKLRDTFLSHVYTAFQGFALGVIVMGFITNYNRSRLPIALICIIISIVSRFLSERY